MTPAAPTIIPKITIARAEGLSASDISDLCAATEDAIERGGGFGWLTPPPRPTLEAYWRGLMMVPGKHLFIARLDGIIAGALQLHEAPKNMESQANIGYVQTGFTATAARGHGIGRGLMVHVINQASAMGLKTLKLDVRETQDIAIRLYRKLGFIEWGRMPRYACLSGNWVAGLYFYLDL